MSTQPSSSPQTDPPPVIVRMPPAVAPAATAPPAEAAPAGGARKLSRWEELEEVWFPEPTDYSHSGINE